MKTSTKFMIGAVLIATLTLMGGYGYGIEGFTNRCQDIYSQKIRSCIGGNCSRRSEPEKEAFDNVCKDVYSQRIRKCVGGKCAAGAAAGGATAEGFSSGTMLQMESNRGSRTDSYLNGLTNPHTDGYAVAKQLQTESGYNVVDGAVSVRDLPEDLIGWMPNVTDNRRMRCSSCR